MPFHGATKKEENAWKKEYKKWAKENEYFVWTYFIENNILFNPDNNYNVTGKFCLERPAKHLL